MCDAGGVGELRSGSTRSLSVARDRNIVGRMHRRLLEEEEEEGEEEEAAGEEESNCTACIQEIVQSRAAASIAINNTA